MLRPIAFAHLPILLVLALTGCVAVGNASLADDTTLAQIKVGETTKQQVATLLGEPSERLSTQHAGYTPEWWAYSYSSSTINPLEYLLVYGFWVNGIGLFDTRRDLQVTFDADGIVRSLSHQVTSYDMGSPATPLHLTSTVIHSIAVEGRSGQPVSFTDKMVYRY